MEGSLAVVTDSAGCIVEVVLGLGCGTCPVIDAAEGTLIVEMRDVCVETAWSVALDCLSLECPTVPVPTIVLVCSGVPVLSTVCVVFMASVFSAATVLFGSTEVSVWLGSVTDVAFASVSDAVVMVWAKDVARLVVGTDTLPVVAVVVSKFTASVDVSTVV